MPVKKRNAKSEIREEKLEKEEPVAEIKSEVEAGVLAQSAVVVPEAVPAVGPAVEPPKPAESAVVSAVPETIKQEVAALAAVGGESQNVVSQSESVPETKKSNWLWLWVLLGFVLGGVLGGGGVYLFLSRTMPDTVENAQKTVQESAGVTPTATPTGIVVNRDELKLQVLNASGVKGAAGTAAQMLTDRGYKDVAVGNADQSDLEVTEIQIKESKQEWLDTLAEDLMSGYEVASEAAVIEEDSDFDAVVLLGLAK